MSVSYDVEMVTSRATFVQFVEALVADWRASEREHPSKSYGRVAAGWENHTIERFLEALAAYAADAELPESTSWRTFAQVLAAATVYE